MRLKGAGTDDKNRASPILCYSTMLPISLVYGVVQDLLEATQAWASEPDLNSLLSLATPKEPRLSR